MEIEKLAFITQFIATVLMAISLVLFAISYF